MRISRFAERVKSDQSTQTSDEQQTQEVGGGVDFLDQFSTSPTYSADLCFSECINHAPLFALQDHDRTYKVIQGCCNSWTCPRCGNLRAKQEYGRIINGCNLLAEDHELYFITITCRGNGLGKSEADKNYGTWTNRLLDAWRLQAKRTNQKWAYVQVTERQKRGHPHSHIITTFRPTDLAVDWRKKRVTENGQSFMAYVSAYRSDYIRRTLCNSGMGSEYDITAVGSSAACARYVAKYLFKDTIFSTIWPKGWKRVRYSQSFPKRQIERSSAFVLIKREDWQTLARKATIVKPDGIYTFSECEFWLTGSDTLLLRR